MLFRWGGRCPGGECPTTVSIVARPRPAARDRRSAAASNSRRKHGGSGRLAAARSVAHLIGRATAAPAEPSVPGNDTRIGSIAAAVEHTHTHTHNLCPGRPGWAGTTRSIHPFTPNRSLSTSSIYYDPQHPPCPIYVLGSPFSQPLFRSSASSWSGTLYLASIHFFAQSYRRRLATHARTVAASFAVYCRPTNVMSSILPIYLFYSILSIPPLSNTRLYRESGRPLSTIVWRFLSRFSSVPRTIRTPAADAVATVYWPWAWVGATIVSIDGQLT